MRAHERVEIAIDEALRICDTQEEEDRDVHNCGDVRISANCGADNCDNVEQAGVDNCGAADCGTKDNNTVACCGAANCGETGMTNYRGANNNEDRQTEESCGAEESCEERVHVLENCGADYHGKVKSSKKL